MLECVIPSKTRVHILIRLFSNPATRAYLRELSSDFAVSTNAVRTELNRLRAHKLVVAERCGRNVYYRANAGHPLFPELAAMVRKTTGVAALARLGREQLGRIEAAYVAGDYAKGLDTGVIDLILVGTEDWAHVADLVHGVETEIGRRVRALLVTRSEFQDLLGNGALQPVLALWEPVSEHSPTGQT